MDLAGNVIATGFRRSRCTVTGCGANERWYFGHNKAHVLKAKSTAGSILIKARGTLCVQIRNVYDRREEG